MELARNLFLLGFPLILTGCNGGATCKEWDEYIFTASPSQISIGAGEEKSFVLNFYPIPERRIKLRSEFNSNLLFSTRYDREPIRGTTDGDTKLVKVSSENPLEFQLSVSATSNADKVVLDFGSRGKLDVKSGDEATIRIYLVPLPACFSDSGENNPATQISLKIN